MKKIEAIIREKTLESVMKALKDAGINPITTYSVRGRGRQGGIVHRWAEGVEVYELLPHVKVEVVVPDELVDKVVDIIIKHARRGVPGDGKIFIIPVEEAVRIRTGERGHVALM